MYLLLFLVTSFAFSQSVEGLVTDKAGAPLIGVTIINKTTKAGATSNFDGKYSIKASDEDVLVFTYIGYKPLTQKVSSKILNIIMEEEVTTLQEVVAVGYGTRKAVDATMAIAKVKADEIAKQKVLNPLQGTQGKLTGVTIVGNDAPGAEPMVVIRGVNSFVNAGIPPLYVVDGFYQSNINNLNSNNIESFEILKDASALAIYGNQAANGVVIITTKKGKGDLKVTTDSFMGIRNPLKIVKMAGSNLYAQYNNIANQTIIFSQDQPVNTNWIKETLKSGLYYSNDLTLSGSSEKITYNLNANTFSEYTIFEGAKYYRNTFRLNNDFKLAPKVTLKTGVNIGFTNTTNKGGVLNTAYKQAPIVPVRYSDGKYGQPFLGTNGFVAQSGLRFNNVGNPVADLDLQNDHSKNLNLILNVGLDAKIHKYLKYNAIFGVEINNWKGYNFGDYRRGFFIANPTETVYSGKYYNGLTLSRSNGNEWNFNNFLTSNFIISEIHNFELMAGVEMIKRGGGEYLGGIRYNLPAQESYWQFGFSNEGADMGVWGGQGNDRRKFSYFARTQYKLLDRYLATFNIRRDGSSQYLPGYQWGTFPSVGLGWIVSNEQFLKENKFLTFLKLRGGWGLLGSDAFGRNIQTLSFGTNGYSFGEAPVPFTANTTFIDSSISWEETREHSVGADFEILKGMFKGSIDFYDKQNRNSILYIASSSGAGQTGATARHAAKVSNKGAELSLNYHNKLTDNFRFDVGGNVTYNKNELKEVSDKVSFMWTQDLNNGPNGGLKMMSKEALGQPIGSYYIYEYAGVDEQGRMLYYNQAGEKVLQNKLVTKDRKFFGSAMPHTTYGINLSATYKNIDVSVQGYGTMGAKVFNAKRAQRISNENIELEIAKDFWTPQNTDAAHPAPISEIPYASTYYLESGDFFRINNINVSYTFSELNKFFKGGSFYVNIINPFITQKYSGFSPEISGNPIHGMGVENGVFPTLRSVVTGVKLNF